MTITYSVANIVCGHCARTIENELSDMPGVHFVKVDAHAHSVEITFEPPATELGLEKLLTEINYPVLGRADATASH
jgi:copper chaperone